MKRFILFASAFTMIISFGALAQMRMDPAERAKELKEQLKLSDEQTVKVQKIFENAQAEAMSQMNGDSGSRSERRGAMQSIMVKAQEKVMTLLTDEQKTAYQKIIDERKSQRQKRN